MIDNPSYQDFSTRDDSAYPELWDGCVGAWAPCLGPTGTRLHDNSGRQNWGTLTNMDAATDWVVDGGHYALDFDGTNDYVSIGKSDVYLTSGPISICGWCKTSASDSQNAIISSATANGIFSNFTVSVNFFSNGRLDFWQQAGGPFLSSAVAVNDGNWFFWCVTRGPQSTTIYINGRFSSSAANSIVYENQANQELAIGRFGAFNGYYSPMRIYEVAIWHRTLSALDILRIYNFSICGMYTPRRRRKAYFGQQFNAAWARGSNQFIQPSLIGVA